MMFRTSLKNGLMPVFLVGQSLDKRISIANNNRARNECADINYAVQKCLTLVYT